MKKIILLTFLIYISLTSYTNAAGTTCPIEDKSAQVLLDYIKDNKQVVKNITTAIVKRKKEINLIKNNENNQKKDFLGNQIDGITNSLQNTIDDAKKSTNETISIFNQMFNFTGYYSYFKYFVTFPIFNETPYQVKRDYNIINNENKSLLEYIKKIDRNLSAAIVIKDACKGIKSKCLFNEGQTAKDIIGKLIQNNDKILNLFRSTVILDNTIFEYKDFILIDKGFIKEIEKNYGRIAINACSNSDGGFAERIMISIKNINLINQQGSDGIKKWSDAWQLLIGNSPDEESAIARKELKKYLSNAGVSTENQEIALNNLDKYSQEGLSLNNNFLTNTFNSTISKIKKEAMEWGDMNFGEFLEKNTKNTNLNYLKNMEDSARITNNIKNTISKLYNEELPFTAIGDITTEKLRARVIDTHFSLENSIQTLENTIKNAQKFCKSTDKNSGNCE